MEEREIIETLYCAVVYAALADVNEADAVEIRRKLKNNEKITAAEKKSGTYLFMSKRHIPEEEIPHAIHEIATKIFDEDLNLNKEELTKEQNNIPKNYLGVGGGEE